MSSSLQPGSTIAGFRLEALVGRGGMGLVYRAEQIGLARKVAIKVIAPQFAEDAYFRDRFLRESQLAASIEHPSVIPIYDAGEVDGLLYLAMRYVEGEDLRALLERERKLAPARTLEIVGPVAAALDAAHLRGLVHRDVKPANILLTRGDAVYLTDFGLTKQLGESRLTATGEFVGSMHYVPPEQIKGGVPDGRGDVYSTACVLFECLSGQVPFPSTQEVAVLYSHLSAPPPEISTVAAELPPGLDAVFAQGLAKDPEERPATCVELVDAVREAFGGLTRAHPRDPEATVAGSAWPRSAAAERQRHVGRKVVTVLLAELRVVAGAGEPADPEIVPQVWPHAIEAARRIVERHGGSFEAALGDLVLGVFGMQVVHEDDALRAVRAGAELREEIRALNAEWAARWHVQVEVRVGVATGEAMTGETASLAAGGIVNAAAPLQQSAGPGEVLLATQTHRLVRGRVDAELIGTSPGRPAWRLRGVLDRSATTRRLDAPVVGREKEQARLQQAFDQVVDDGACHLLTLLGPAGVGKSRLVDEFLAEVAETASVLRSACLSYGEGITFWPLLEIVRQAVGAQEGESPARTVERIETRVAEEPDARLIADRLAHMLGLAQGTGISEEGFWAVRKLFGVLAQRRPLVVAFDDLHWAEPTLLELIEYLADWSRDSPVFLLCVARPELLDVRPGWAGGKLNATSVLLEPLDEDASMALLDTLLGAGTVPEVVRRKISDAAEGNPLFVEEMLAMLIDEGSLRRENGDWVMVADLSTRPIPPTVQAVLAARLDRLTEDERAVIECGAIEGKVFHHGAVDTLVDGELRPRVMSQLMTLVRKELVRPDRAEIAGEDAFRFRHILIRDAAYHSVSKQLRADLHERFAAWLEGAAGQRSVEYQEILGYHREQAYRYRGELGQVDDETRALGERAGAALAAAGRRAVSRDDPPAAAKLLERALALLPEGDADRAAVTLQLADSLRTLGQLERAGEMLAAAHAAAVLAGDQRLALHAELDRYSLALSTSPGEQRADELATFARWAIRAFEGLGDASGLAKAWRLVSDADWFACRMGARADALERALVHAGADAREEARILLSLASALVEGATPVPEAMRRCQEILVRAEGRPVLEAGIRALLASLTAMEGRFDDARRLYRSSQATLDELGLTLAAAARTTVGGEIELLAGNLDEAERELERGSETLRAMGEKSVFSTVAGMLADVLARRGRLDEAERVVSLAEDATADEDVLSQVLWRCARSRLAAASESLERAETLAREAVALANSTDELNVQAGARAALTNALYSAGRTSEAAAEAQQAVALYEEKGNSAAAASARREFAAVSG